MVELLSVQELTAYEFNQRLWHTKDAVMEASWATTQKRCVDPSLKMKLVFMQMLKLGNADDTSIEDDILRVVRVNTAAAHRRRPAMPSAGRRSTSSATRCAVCRPRAGG